MGESDNIQIEPIHDGGAQDLLEKKLGDKVNKDGIAELAGGGVHPEASTNMFSTAVPGRVPEERQEKDKSIKLRSGTSS